MIVLSVDSDGKSVQQALSIPICLVIHRHLSVEGTLSLKSQTPAKIGIWLQLHAKGLTDGLQYLVPPRREPQIDSSF
jgi:hypothetical protein